MGDCTLPPGSRTGGWAVGTSRGDASDLLLDRIGALDEQALVALAEQGRDAQEPPAFSGRSLEPAYLAAVASGDWTVEDEQRLALLVERAEAAVLGRVRRRYRRGLSRALRMAALSVCSRNLPMTNWPDRRRALEGPWERAVGPLPFPDRRRS